MNNLGFVKIASGNKTYFVGGPSGPAIRECISLGGDTSSYVGQAHTNIMGYMTFNLF